MGRKGDIGTKILSSRVPIKLYTKLLNEADDKGIAIGVYIRDILAKDNFSQGGQTKIEYKEKVVYRDKIVEVPKIQYRDRIIEKKVEIDNPKISQENVDLKKQIQLLEDEIKELKKFKSSKTPIEPPHIAIARIDVKNGTADERVIKMIQRLDSKK